MPIYPVEVVRILAITELQYRTLLTTGALRSTWLERERPLGSVRPHTFLDLVELTRGLLWSASTTNEPDSLFGESFDFLVEDVFLVDGCAEKFWCPVEGHLNLAAAATLICETGEPVHKVNISILFRLLMAWDDLERRTRKVIFDNPSRSSSCRL